MLRSSTTYKWKQSKTVLKKKYIYICGWILMFEDKRTWTFCWRKQYYGLWSCSLARWNGLKYKMSWICFLQAHRFSLHKMLIYWSGVDYLWIIVMFLSAVCTFIHSAPIHCRESIDEQVILCYISPNLMKKHTDLGGLKASNIQQIFIFGWTVPLNITNTRMWSGLDW